VTTVGAVGYMDSNEWWWTYYPSVHRYVWHNQPQSASWIISMNYVCGAQNPIISNKKSQKQQQTALNLAMESLTRLYNCYKDVLLFVKEAYTVT